MAGFAIINVVGGGTAWFGGYDFIGKRRTYFYL